MRKIALTVCLLVGLCASGAVAQSQQEMNQQAAADFQKADKELNRVYKLLTGQLGKNEKDKLVTAQLLWIKLRDADAAARAAENEGGSIYPLIYDGSRASSTIERTRGCRSGMTRSSSGEDLADLGTQASKWSAMLDPVYTLDDLRDLEGEYELDEGQLVPVTRAQRTHGRVCAYLTADLVQHCRKTGQGEVLGNDTGFVLQRSPDTLRGPDIAVIAAERLKDVPADGWPEGAPDLVVEVVSPSNRPGELQRKIGQYLDAGARLIWVLYPERRTAVQYDAGGNVELFGEGQSLSGEPVLPGFRCSLSELYA